MVQLFIIVTLVALAYAFHLFKVMPTDTDLIKIRKVTTNYGVFIGFIVGFLGVPLLAHHSLIFFFLVAYTYTLMAKIYLWKVKPEEQKKGTPKETLVHNLRTLRPLVGFGLWLFFISSINMLLGAGMKFLFLKWGFTDIQKLSITLIHIPLFLGLILISTPIQMLLMFPCKRVRDPYLVSKLNELNSINGKKVFYNYWVVTAPRFYNAAVTGILKFGWIFKRGIFIGEKVLELLDQEEFEAVVKHEMAHVHLHHLLKRGLGSLGFVFFGTVVITTTIIIGNIYAETPTWQAGLSLVYFFAFFASLTFLIREQEYEADAFAVTKLGANRKALIGALDKLIEKAKGRKERSKDTILNFIVPFMGHPSVDKRDYALRMKSFLTQRNSKMKLSWFSLRSWWKKNSVHAAMTAVLILTISLIAFPKVKQDFIAKYSKQSNRVPAAERALHKDGNSVQ